MSTAENSGRSMHTRAGAMADDIATEVKSEARDIRNSNQPVDPTHTDTVVRRHVAGLSISFFVLIALFLLAAIVGIALYAHHEKSGTVQQHIGAVMQDYDGPIAAQPILMHGSLRTLSGSRIPVRGALSPAVHRSSYR
jgi:hypothetical protein